MIHHGIQEDHILDSRDLGLSKCIKHMRGGNGVDVIINSIASEAMQETWECLAPFGRFVELGKEDNLGQGGLDMKRFAANTSFAAVNIEVREDQDG